MNKRTYLLSTIGLLIGLFTLASIALDTPIPEQRLIVRPFQIQGSAIDSTLDQNHAQFELHFSDYSLNRNTPFPEIELSCNGVIHRFQLDSTLHKTQVGIYFIKNPEPREFQVPRNQKQQRHGRPGEKVALKPVIYLYAPTDIAVDVQLTPKGAFTYTYPSYEKGWKGTVEANGGITINNNHYPYLFWEGNIGGMSSLVDYSEGFVVSAENVTTFLEEKLTEMGLTEQEKTDFITFWGPRMVHSEKNHVQFLFNEAYDNIATLKITPKPDHTFRLYMLWTPLPESTTLNPTHQKLASVKRDGFSVVEWGGSELTFTPDISFTH
jgi:hypothetical protein